MGKNITTDAAGLRPTSQWSDAKAHCLSAAQNVGPRGISAVKEVKLCSGNVAQEVRNLQAFLADMLPQELAGKRPGSGRLPKRGARAIRRGAPVYWPRQ
jgi:hypothetical protein